MASVLAGLVNTMAQAGSSGRPAGMAPSVAALAQMLAGGAVQPGVPAVPHGLGPQWIDPHGSGEVGGRSIGGLIGPGTGFGAGGGTGGYLNPGAPTPGTPYSPGNIPGPGDRLAGGTLPTGPAVAPPGGITSAPPGGGPAYGNPTVPPAILTGPGPGGGPGGYGAPTAALKPGEILPTAQWQPAGRPASGVGSTQYPVFSATSQYKPPAGAENDPTYGRKVPAVENIGGRPYEVNIPEGSGYGTYLRTLIAAAGGGPGINNVGAEAAAKNPALLFNEGKPVANWSGLGTVTPVASAGTVSAVPVDPVKRAVTGCR